MWMLVFLATLAGGIVGFGLGVQFARWEREKPQIVSDEDDSNADYAGMYDALLREGARQSAILLDGEQ